METTPPSIARKPPSPADFNEPPVSPPPPPFTHAEFHRGPPTPTPLPDVHRGHPTPLPNIHHSTPLPDLVTPVHLPLVSPNLPHPTPVPIHPHPTPVNLPPPSPLLEAQPVVESVTPVPEIFNQIPGLNPDHLTEADLLLADPTTHTHPLGTHPLLPIHPGHDIPHSHPPFNQHPVVDVATGTVLSNPDLPDHPLLDVQQTLHEVHPVPGILAFPLIFRICFTLNLVK